ncbi:MAG: 30S ribosomal protein S5 [Planctomycetes bacterium]|nr:30S ribosomal protein S5 [Planctomycetota bacterium]
MPAETPQPEADAPAEAVPEATAAPEGQTPPPPVEKAPRGRGGREERGGRGRGDRGDRGDREGKRDGGKRRGPKRREDSDQPEDEFTDTLVPGGIFRCSATVKGGRRLSFAALVVVGDGKGTVGAGYGKAKEVPMAIQKAIKIGRRNVAPFPLVGDGTIPHEVHGRFGAAHVVLVPAGPGTGVIAGSTVKTVLEMGGVRNVLTKSFGSNNRKNLVKATVNALKSLRSHELVESLRGVKIS